MTIRSLRYAVLLAGLMVLKPGDSFAELKQGVQALEFSLRSLYDSANEVDKKNKWLSEEIARMNEEAIFLTEELKSLEADQAKQAVETAVNEEGVLKDMPWEEERANMMIEDLAELNEEEAYLKDRLEGKSNDQKEIEQAVVNMQKEAAQLAKERAQLQGKLQQPPESKDLERLKETLERSTRNLTYAQKKYERMEKELGLPVKVFKESKFKHKELEAKESYFREQLQSQREREGQLVKQMDVLLNDAQIVGLDNEINALLAQRQELTEALEQAQTKLGKDFRVPVYKEELENVKSNIDVIKEENQELKKKLMQLEKKLQGIEADQPPG